MKYRVAVLGATGTIGKQTLDVIKRNAKRYVVSALVGNQNETLLEEQSKAFGGVPYYLGILECKKAILDADIVVAAISGFAGLDSVLEAVKQGKKIALANKEALVAAGDLIMPLAKASGSTIIPVDSEHSAVYQCLKGLNQGERVESIQLTASGGPFLNRPFDSLSTVTPEEAAEHPKWKMGKKISIDSATMFNKALEIIEAHHLFGPKSIKVLIHPESIIHGIINLTGGRAVAALSLPDMRIPIAYALDELSGCVNTETGVVPLSLSNLSFLEPDFGRFPALPLAYQALAEKKGVILNAANEEAVSLFCAGKLKFTQISEVVSEALSLYYEPADTLEGVYAADALARDFVRKRFDN